MSVTVHVLVFSGLPPPTFDLGDEQAQQFVDLVKAATAGAQVAALPQAFLGYGGFTVEPPAELDLPAFLIISQGLVLGETNGVRTAWPDANGCEEWLKERTQEAGLGELVYPNRGAAVPPDVIRPEGRRLGLADELLAGALDFARRILAQLEAAALINVPSFAAAAGVPGFADLDGDVAANLNIARTRLQLIAPGMASGDLAGAAGHIAILLSAVNTAALKVGGKPLRDIVLGSVNWGGLAPLGLAKQLGLPSGKPDRLFIDSGVAVFELDANAVRLAPAPVLFGFERATLAARLRTDGKAPVFSVSLALRDAEVGIGGGPVSDLLGGASGSARADFALGVDSTHGLTLSAGASKHIVLPARTASGPFELREITVQIPEGRPDTFAIGTTVSLKLGPLQATVEGAGVSLHIDSNAAASGNSPLAVGLNAPNGIGVTLDAGIVRGGGFLEERSGGYGGALQFRLGPVEVNAFGLLTLKPDFALVVVMSARFTPAIDLSFGFTLNAVGGLLGIEHRLDGDALAAQISSGALEHILFPPDPVAAAPSILHTLEQVFPVSQGSFVIGPMIEIGWGRPVSFITAQIGVILSLPDPKIAIIGRGRIALPAPQLPIVDLRATVLAEIDSERFYMRASLVGSRIATFPVNGDIGVLLRWSGGAEFALSAGGFHPLYSPPRELCDMRRLGMDLSPPAILRMRGESYFALTSNSIQLGSRIDMSADLDVVAIDGHFAFDALVIYAPHFRFLIELGIGISVRALGETIGGVSVQLHLEGPAPWRAEGHAEVEIFGFDIPVDVGPFTWGDAHNPPPAPADPRQLVFDALNHNPGAWQAIVPPEADQVVRLKSVQPSDVDVTVHPMGLFEVRQRAVPLETVLVRVGPSPVPEGQRRVCIGLPLVGAVPAGAVSEATDLFSPGVYLDLTDDQKLSRPGFEPMPAGARVRPPGERVDVGSSRHAELRYETFVCDDESMRGKHGVAVRDLLFAKSASKALGAGAAGSSALRARERYVTKPDPITFADAGAVTVVLKSTVTVAAGAVTQTYTHAAEQTLTAELQLARLGVAA